VVPPIRRVDSKGVSLILPIFIAPGPPCGGVYTLDSFPLVVRKKKIVSCVSGNTHLNHIAYTLQDIREKIGWNSRQVGTALLIQYYLLYILNINYRRLRNNSAQRRCCFLMRHSCWFFLLCIFFKLRNSVITRDLSYFVSPMIFPFFQVKWFINLYGMRIRYGYYFF
jgi:hypothetical protein